MEHLMKCFVVAHRLRINKDLVYYTEIGYIMAESEEKACEKIHCQMVKNGVVRPPSFFKEVLDFYFYECDEARKNNLSNSMSKESWGELSGPSVREFLAVIDLLV